MQELVPSEVIEGRIYLFRGQKVMVDRDLASLYGATTKSLNQSVNRNLERFPTDFMFKLSLNEAANLRSQIVTSSSGHGGTRWQPYAFTEQGVAMLSSVLNSRRAIAVNIQIIRTFTKLRELLAQNDDLRRKVEMMEKQYGENFKIIFDAIHRMLDENAEPKPEIGFTVRE